GSLIARLNATDGIRYYHFDELGSTRLLTDADGDITDRYTYDAYGSLLSHDAYTGSVQQPYGYVGQLGYHTHWMEPDFGLLQLGVRFYDPEVGRFGQRDPMQDGLNQYAYADGNPIWHVDPTGEFVIVIAGGCAIGAAELSLAVGAIASYACGSNEDCRRAVAEAAESLYAAIMNAARATGRCCLKVLKIRCSGSGIHTRHRHPFPHPTRPGKKCWKKHIHIRCHFSGIPNSEFLNKPIGFGPCYRKPDGPETW
ncbi:MAG: RHS repeat domain-containing protein, partial [Armatimonadota bacterium]